MAVAGGHTVEFLEYVSEVVFLDADSVVPDAYFQSFLSSGFRVDISRRGGTSSRMYFTALSKRLKMTLVNCISSTITSGLSAVRSQLNAPPNFSTLILKVLDHAGYCRIGVHYCEFQCSSGIVEDRELKHLGPLENAVS